MQIERIPTSAEQLPLIRNLYQFYAYESSDWEGEDIETNGLFYINDEHLAGYWREPGWRAELILADGYIAGFVLIEQVEISGAPVNELADLFILRKYRRYGIPRAVALQIIDGSSPWLMCAYAHDPIGYPFCQHILKEIEQPVQKLPAAAEDPELLRYLITPQVH